MAVKELDKIKLYLYFPFIWFLPSTGNYRPTRLDSQYAASPRPQTPREPHDLTQRSSFVFSGSKGKNIETVLLCCHL